LKYGTNDEQTLTPSTYARSLIEASLDPFVTISTEGKITDVNKATELVTGCSRDKLIGTDFSDYFTDPEKAKAGYLKVFSEGFVKDYPLAIQHKSGIVTYVLYNATVYRNEAGEIQGIFAVARDITELKQAEEQARQASLYSRSLIEASLDPLVTISAQGKITDVNNATEDVTGYSRSQLIGSDFADYFTEPEKARIGYKNVFTEGLVKDYPLAIRHKSGKVTDVLYNASVYRDTNGTIQGVFASARDVTERKKIDDAVHQSEVKFRTVADFTYDWEYWIGPDGNFIYVSPSCKRFTGYNPDDFIKDPKLISNIIHPDDIERVGSHFETVTKDEAHEFDFRIITPTGQTRWIAHACQPVFDDKGKWIGRRSSNRDITPRKVVEEKLLAASLYSRSLIEASLDPLVTISVEGKITDVNKATEEVTGYYREQLVGSDFSDYFTEPEKARAGYKKVFSEGYVRDYPLAICHKSGKITDVLYNANVYRNEGGAIQGVFAAARDITERKVAEEKLLAASLYSRSLLEASLDPLVTISADGEITDVNQAAENVTGFTRGQLIGSDFSDYFTEPEKARAGYKQVFTEGFVKDYPLSIRSKSGLVTAVLYNASIYRNPNGEVQGVFAAARDITKRIAMENELRQTMDKLKQSNAELEQFAYVASHDLQEPLRMVASYVQLLERRYKGKLDSDADEFISYAVDGANRMRGLIDDLLTYSRVSRLGKPFEPVDLKATMEIVLSNLQASIKDANAVITHDKLPIIQADSGQMTQLFQNLIGNAIKFHGKEKPRIHISAKTQEEEYLFSIKDNGIGIDPKYIDRLFKIFQRLHTKQEYPGSGIGLVICKKIVERHGGRIWLESRLEKGSTVYFTLRKKQ
jgi:PAS domain S-box-containing protein